MSEFQYKINNIKTPPINSMIVVSINNKNLIGIVELIHHDNIYVLLLNQNGRIKINKNSEWYQINPTDLSELRYDYKIFINEDPVQILNDAYVRFYKNNIKK